MSLKYSLPVHKYMVYLQNEREEEEANGNKLMENKHAKRKKSTVNNSMQRERETSSFKRT